MLTPSDRAGRGDNQRTLREHGEGAHAATVDSAGFPLPCNELKLVAGDMTRLIDTANAPIFGIDKNGLVNEWNQTAAKITK